MPTSKYLPASKYLHVARRRQGKAWQAMVCGKYLGTFATMEEAAQKAADELGQPKKTLLRSRPSSGTPKTIAKPAKPPKRSHRFVYWHRTESKWQVKSAPGTMAISPSMMKHSR